MKNFIGRALQTLLVCGTALFVLPSLALAQGCEISIPSGPVTPRSVAGQNITAAAEFIRSMGNAAMADNIIQYLDCGKIYKEDLGSDAGGHRYITGNITLNNAEVQPVSAPFTSIPEEAAFPLLIRLASTLFHEKIHAHQSFLTYISFAEAEAWSQEIFELDRWAHHLIEKYDATGDRKYLEQALETLEYKIDTLDEFINVRDCFEFDCEDFRGYLKAVKRLKDVLEEERPERNDQRVGGLLDQIGDAERFALRDTPFISAPELVPGMAQIGEPPAGPCAFYGRDTALYVGFGTGIQSGGFESATLTQTLEGGEFEGGVRSSTVDLEDTSAVGMLDVGLAARTGNPVLPCLFAGIGIGGQFDRLDTTSARFAGHSPVFDEIGPSEMQFRSENDMFVTATVGATVLSFEGVSVNLFGGAKFLEDDVSVRMPGPLGEELGGEVDQVLPLIGASLEASIPAMPIRLGVTGHYTFGGRDIHSARSDEFGNSSTLSARRSDQWTLMGRISMSFPVGR